MLLGYSTSMGNCYILLFQNSPSDPLNRRSVKRLEQMSCESYRLHNYHVICGMLEIRTKGSVCFTLFFI